MFMRLRHGRRSPFYLKIAACILIAVFYFAILFRASLNAFEQNKAKVERASAKLERASAMLERAKAMAAALSAEMRLSSSQELRLKAPDAAGNALQHKKRNQAKASQRSAATTAAASAAAAAAGLRTSAAATTAASTLNPVYEYSAELHSATERELDRRRAHLLAVCARHNLQALYPPNPWEFFISPGHGLVWCNVFKAASSTWMYYFNILGGYDIRYLQRTETQPLELARKRFPRPELDELHDNLAASLSFLFVRDPFERIVSAYRNKLEGGRNSFYKALSHKIIQQFRQRSTAAGSGAAGAACGPATAGRPRSANGPTFSEFSRYLIDQHGQQKRFDEHWAPVYSFCTPCSVNFSIIGKVETFQRDSEFIIRQAGLESLLLGKVPRHKMRKIGNQAKDGKKTDGLVARYFSTVERETLDDLLNIYRLDFELFDYDYSKYYDLVQPAASAGGSGCGATTAAANARTENSTASATTTDALRQIRLVTTDQRNQQQQQPLLKQQQQ